MNNKIPISKLKDGDFCIMQNSWVFILDHFEQTIEGKNVIIFKAFYSFDTNYIIVPEEPHGGIGYYEDCGTLRYANNYERKMFMDKLKRKRYAYNEETKHIEII